MIKVDNLEVGKRYWLDNCKNISGVFKGRFNPEPELDYITFNNVVQTNDYSKGYHIRKNGDIEFAYTDDLTFPECEIISKQLELSL